MTKEKRLITLENGEQTEASFPVIVSASRRTDIPAFYSEWFFERLRLGHSIGSNPFNGKKHVIAYADTKFIVFWSKNPAKLLERLNYLDERGIGCYIHFTLNDYEKEKLETGVPPLGQRISTFRKIATRLGKGSVIWRFDPLLLTDAINIDTLVARIRAIGNQLHEYTEKLVFSYADILSYRRVKANLEKRGVSWRDWTLKQMREFTWRLVTLNRAEGWDLRLATCGELADLPGVEHNKCIDDRLILRRAHYAPELLKYLGAEIRSDNDLFGNIPSDGIDIGAGRYVAILKNNRDKGQRQGCGCVKSTDIGQYDTCLHFCEYCYANSGRESALRNCHLLPREGASQRRQS